MMLTDHVRVLIFVIGFAAVSQSTHAQKIQGVCFSAPPREVGDTCIAQVQAIGAEWVCFIPYAYGPDNNGRIIFDPNGHQWWGERPVGIRAMVAMAKARGLKVMLKPHLWLGHGEFTGAYEPDPAVGWGPFEQSYAEYVLYFAKLATELDVDLFCIGTEMERFVTQRTNYWQVLIDRISEEYNGPLTYAANWDEVVRFPLWKRMAYIGVDGYFPLCQKGDPTMAELRTGWEPHLAMLKELSLRLDRPVLFTELGYTNTSTCAKEPWAEDQDAVRNEAAQALAFEAFFHVFSKETWYSGCFIWKWFAEGGVRESRNGVGFSLQRKVAIRVLKEHFQ